MKALVWSVAGALGLRLHTPPESGDGGVRAGVAGSVIAGPASAAIGAGAGAVVLPTVGDRTKELGACS